MMTIGTSQSFTTACMWWGLRCGGGSCARAHCAHWIIQPCSPIKMYIKIAYNWGVYGLFRMFQLYLCISFRHQSKALEKIIGLTTNEWTVRPRFWTAWAFLLVIALTYLVTFWKMWRCYIRITRCYKNSASHQAAILLTAYFHSPSSSETLRRHVIQRKDPRTPGGRRGISQA